jgi:signal transduction histidine kinase
MTLPDATRATTLQPSAAPRSAVRDAIYAALFVLAGGACLVALDTAERVSHAMLAFEWLQLDDLLLTSGLAVLATTWFAWRRWHDAARELRARQASEAERALSMQRLEQLSGQLLETEQRERERLAALLHDEVGQTLYACRLQLERLGQHLHDPTAPTLVEEARQLTELALNCTRELTADLSPPILHDLGLVEALEWLLRRNQQRFGLQAQLVPSAHWSSVPRAWHAAVFHSVSELLSNAIKHAHARHVEVAAAISGDGALHIEVRDDGVGFAPAQGPERSGGFGLFSIERRLAQLGGALQLAPGRPGTVARLRLPRPDSAA